PHPLVETAIILIVAHEGVHGSASRSVSMRGRSFIIVRTGCRAVDMSLQHMAWPEHEDTAWQDRHFFSGFRIAADASSLLPDRKSPEPTDFNRFTLLQMGRDTL